MTRADYSTPCPLSPDERHTWEADPGASSPHSIRFGCVCGARGYIGRGMHGDKSTKGRPVVQAKAGGKSATKRVERFKPSTITVKEKAGNNATGHYLPPGSSGGRR